MIDITNEIAGIQAATTGSQIRISIISALQALNSALPSMYTGSYSITPSTSGFFLLTAGLAFASSLYIDAYPQASLISATFSENGSYQAASYSANGFAAVFVSIPLSSASFSENGSYVASDYSAAGFDQIDISVPMVASYWSGTESDYSALSEYSTGTVYLIASAFSSAIDIIYLGSTQIWPEPSSE